MTGVQLSAMLLQFPQTGENIPHQLEAERMLTAGPVTQLTADPDTEAHSMTNADTVRYLSNEGPQARELLRLHREHLLNYRPVFQGESSDDNSADPPRATLSVQDWPADIQLLVFRYEGSHPGTHLTPLRYIVSSGNSSSTAVNPGELPDEDHLVGLAITEAVVDADHAEMHTCVLVAQLTTSEQQ